MAQLAGQMQAGTGNGDDWLDADGTFISRMRYPDYHRQVGGREGKHGMTFLQLPLNPGWQVCVRDDPNGADPGGPIAGQSPPPRILIEPMAAEYHYVPPANAAQVRVRGTVSPPGTALEAAIVTDGSTGGFTAIPSDSLGKIDVTTAFPTNVESIYQFRIRATDFAGADQMTSEFIITPQPIKGSVAWQPPRVAQGSYTTSGTVDPPDSALDCVLVRWDGNETPQAITVTGGTFDAGVYVDQVGGPCRLEFRGAGSPDAAFVSPDFEVYQAIQISAVPLVQTTGAAVMLHGTFAGQAWETAEYGILIGGVLDTDHVPLPLLGGGFAAAVTLGAGAGYAFEVRKVENPGISARSNVFDVVAPGALDAAEEQPPGDKPVNTAVPYASQIGNTLDCTMGEWTGEPTSYDYQWQLDGENIATGQAYMVTADDAGRVATCIVTASNAAGATDAPPSNEVLVAVPPDLTLRMPEPPEPPASHRRRR